MLEGEIVPSNVAWNLPPSLLRTQTCNLYSVSSRRDGSCHKSLCHSWKWKSPNPSQQLAAVSESSAGVSQQRSIVYISWGSGPTLSKYCLGSVFRLFCWGKPYPSNMTLRGNCHEGIFVKSSFSPTPTLAFTTVRDDLICNLHHRPKLNLSLAYSKGGRK